MPIRITAIAFATNDNFSLSLSGRSIRMTLDVFFFHRRQSAIDLKLKSSGCSERLSMATTCELRYGWQHRARAGLTKNHLFAVNEHYSAFCCHWHLVSLLAFLSKQANERNMKLFGHRLLWADECTRTPARTSHIFTNMRKHTRILRTWLVALSSYICSALLCVRYRANYVRRCFNKHKTLGVSNTHCHLHNPMEIKITTKISFPTTVSPPACHQLNFLSTKKKRNAIAGVYIFVQHTNNREKKTTNFNPSKIFIIKQSLSLFSVEMIFSTTTACDTYDTKQQQARQQSTAKIEVRVCLCERFVSMAKLVPNYTKKNIFSSL